MHDAADLLLDRRKPQSFNGIAKWLQESGYETTTDYHRPKDKKRGKAGWCGVGG
jgi:hypothetical protein